MHYLKKYLHSIGPFKKKLIKKVFFVILAHYAVG